MIKEYVKTYVDLPINLSILTLNTMICTETPKYFCLLSLLKSSIAINHLLNTKSFCYRKTHITLKFFQNFCWFDVVFVLLFEMYGIQSVMECQLLHIARPPPALPLRKTYKKWFLWRGNVVYPFFSLTLDSLVYTARQLYSK